MQTNKFTLNRCMKSNWKTISIAVENNGVITIIKYDLDRKGRLIHRFPIQRKRNLMDAYVSLIKEKRNVNIQQTSDISVMTPNLNFQKPIEEDKMVFSTEFDIIFDLPVLDNDISDDNLSEENETDQFSFDNCIVNT